MWSNFTNVKIAMRCNESTAKKTNINITDNFEALVAWKSRRALSEGCGQTLEEELYSWETDWGRWVGGLACVAPQVPPARDIYERDFSYLWCVAFVQKVYSTWQLHTIASWILKSLWILQRVFLGDHPAEAWTLLLRTLKAKLFWRLYTLRPF